MTVLFRLSLMLKLALGEAAVPMEPLVPDLANSAEVLRALIWG